MKIGGMGGFELIIILVVILIIFGPKNLPKLGNAIGKTLSNLRAGMSEGKKKADAAEVQETTAEEKVVPAEIEGVVKEASEVEATGGEDAKDVADEPDEVLGDAEDAVAEAEAAVDEAFQSKKVKRVVKKKVVSEEPVE